jgi:hypothetical protein
MSFYSDLRKIVKDCIIQGLSEFPTTPVIYSHQDAPIPDSTFITVNILSVTQEGMSQQSGRLSEVGEIDVLTPYSMLVNFSATGSQAGDVITSVYQRLKNSPSNVEALAVSNVSVIDKSSITRNAYKANTKWVEFLGFTARFYFISHFSETVYPVETVVVEDLNNSITFTIPPN